MRSQVIQLKIVVDFVEWLPLVTYYYITFIINDTYFFLQLYL